jgi:hypothetical protein
MRVNFAALFRGTAAAAAGGGGVIVCGLMTGLTPAIDPGLETEEPALKDATDEADEEEEEEDELLLPPDEPGPERLGNAPTETALNKMQ